MKGRYNTMKKINVMKFVKEHKSELFIGGVMIAGAVLLKKEFKNINEAFGPDETTKVWKALELNDMIGDMKDEFVDMGLDYVVVRTDKTAYLTGKDTAPELITRLIGYDQQ